ncbi:hypothetical protein [Methyloversatilis sp.]|uniref:hypothetical protein n=1 Tax=Methyloversatilis sp. TaxID=2569862 RepID=UPI0035B0628B
MNHPRCFGIPSVFSFDSPVCSVCPINDDCRAAVLTALSGAGQTVAVRNLLTLHERAQAALKNKVGGIEGFVVKKPAKTLKTRRRSAPRIVLSVEQERSISTAPKKVGKVARTLLERGFTYNGTNPFNHTNRTYYTAFNKLMVGRITKKELRMALCEELGWGETSAYSEVSIIWSLFPILGVARHSDEGDTLEMINIDPSGE